MKVCHTKTISKPLETRYKICLLGLIMMPTKRGDRHAHGSIYQTEIFQEVPLLYPEGKCRVVARNVLKEGADQALDTLTSICALDNHFCSRSKRGRGVKKGGGE